MVRNKAPVIGIVVDNVDMLPRLSLIAECHGGKPIPVTAAGDARPVSDADGMGGLLCVSGHTPVVELLLRSALERDMPILAIGMGLQALNLAMGGAQATTVQGHGSDRNEDGEEASSHRIYISPGSKLAATLGSGGFVTVNSQHSLGLFEAQKSSQLLASAYSIEDGVIEAVESTGHEWVMGVQFHPERKLHVPPRFDRLFSSLVDRSAHS